LRPSAALTHETSTASRLGFAQWAKFEAAITAANIRFARPRVDDRRTIEAIIWRIGRYRRIARLDQRCDQASHEMRTGPSRQKKANAFDLS